MTTPNTEIPEVPEGTLNVAAATNEALRHIDALLQTTVLTVKSLTAPPGSPQDGDMHIIDDAPTGDWAGKANYLTRYVEEGTFWEFFEPGIVAMVISPTGGVYTWDGGDWIPSTGGAGTAADVTVDDSAFSTVVGSNVQDALASADEQITLLKAGASSKMVAVQTVLTLTAPPVSPVDLEKHVVGIGATGAWSGHDMEVAVWIAAYNEWWFLESGRDANAVLDPAGVIWVFAEEDSPGEWVPPSYVVAAENVAYESAAGPGPTDSPTPTNVRDALDALFANVGGAVSAANVAYTSENSPTPNSPFPTSVRDALDEIFETLSALLYTQVSVTIPGKPGAAAIYHMPVAIPFWLLATLPGARVRIGTNPTATATFTLKKNGSSIGTIAISTGGAPTITFSANVHFDNGDTLTVEAPSSQDATMANVGIALKVLRTI